MPFPVGRRIETESAEIRDGTRVSALGSDCVETPGDRRLPRGSGRPDCGFINGVDREQITLFRKRIEGWIGEDRLSVPLTFSSKNSISSMTEG
jgi:hypothetical protein